MTCRIDGLPGPLRGRHVESGETTPPASTGRCKILVVEDDAMIRLAATALVEDHGFEVHEAENADEAIAILEADSDIRIVFTDIQMAGSMDGLQLIAYAHDRWPPLRFIVVSGNRQPDASELPAGAHFFAKPYDGHAIGRALHALVAAA